MNFFEAMEALRQRKKVRKITWDSNCFLQMGVENILDQDGNQDSLITHKPFENNWELFQEPKPNVKRWKWRVHSKLSFDYRVPDDDSSWLTREEAEKIYGNCLIGPWAGPEEFDE